MRHIANLLANGAEISCTQHQDGSPRRPRKTSERPQQCRLPCAVVAQDRVQAARSEVCSHTAQGGKAAELLDKIGKDDDRRIRRRRWD